MTTGAKIAVGVGALLVASGIGYMIYKSMSGNSGQSQPNGNFTDLDSGQGSGSGPNVTMPVSNSDLLDLRKQLGTTGGQQLNASGLLTASSKKIEFLPK